MLMVGKAIMAPYLMKSINVNLTLFSFTKEENIIPASAPIGVKKAPILLPIITGMPATAYADTLCGLI